MFNDLMLLTLKSLLKFPLTSGSKQANEWGEKKVQDM